MTSYQQRENTLLIPIEEVKRKNKNKEKGQLIEEI